MSEDVVQYDQRRLLRLVWRHTTLLVTCVLIGLLVAAVLLQIRGPRYTAETQVLVGEPTTLRSLLVDNTTTRDQDRLVDAQLRRLQSDRTAHLVDEALGAGRAAHQVEFSSGADTNVVVIRVTSSEARTARDAANAYGTVYLELLDRDSDELIAATEKQVAASIQAITDQVTALEQTLANADPDTLPQVEAVVGPTRSALLDRRGVLERQLDQIQLLNGVDSAGGARVISSADDAQLSLTARVTPLLVGAVLGLLFGLAAVAAREALAGTVVDEEDVFATGLAPRAVSYARVKVPQRPVRVGGDLPAAEEAAYRSIAAALWPPHVRLGLDRVCLVAPADGRCDGGAVVVARLAEQLVRMGRRVAVVEGDLTERGVEQVLTHAGDVGLAEVLRHDVSLDEALRSEHGGQLMVLGAGRRPDAAALGSDAFAATLRQVAERVDVVLVSGAPLAGAAESLVVAPLVDRVLVLVRRGRTRRRDLEALRRQVAAQPVEVTTLRHPDVLIHGRRWGGRIRRNPRPSRTGGRQTPNVAGTVPVENQPRPRAAVSREKDDAGVGAHD